MACSTSSLVRTSGLIALTASAALVLVGCGQNTTADDGSAGGADAAVAPPTILAEGELKACTLSSNPPNSYYDENADLIGVEIDVASALAQELGLEAVLEEYAFAGLIPALQAQQCDVIMGSLYITEEREEIANFVPYLYSGTGAGVSSENPQNITGVDDSLCGTRVIGITGATGANTAEELSAECDAAGDDPIEITLVDDGTAAVQQVINGQVDAFIDTSELMAHYETESGGAFEVAGDPVGKVQIGAATLNENEELNTALDTAFQSLIDDGTYLEILESWNVAGNDITQPE